MEIVAVIIIVVAAALVAWRKLGRSFVVASKPDAGAGCGGQCGSCSPALVEIGGKPEACQERN